MIRALWLIEQDTHRCGHLLSETTTTDALGSYDAESLYCEACAAVDRQEEREQGRKGIDRAGRSLYAVDLRVKQRDELPDEKS